jgi:uncharacterized protein (TIGR03083 family)
VDNAQVYWSIRSEFLAMGRVLGPAGTSTPVPALPGWTVADAFAHVTGLCSDVLDGNMVGAGTPPWTARQVAERANRPFVSVCDEWAERGPALEAWLRDQTDASTMFVVFDVWSHFQDLRGALVVERILPNETRYVARNAAKGFERRYLESGAPPLRVRTRDFSYRFGEGEPAVELRTDDYELLRIVFGRRSRGQIEAADWSDDPTPFIDHLHLFDLPEHDLHD